MVSQRFPIRFSGIGRVMHLLAIHRGNSYVEVDPLEVRVRMAWCFRLTAPRAAVRSVEPSTWRGWGWGAHGWRGEWLVNGSTLGVVRIELDPRVRGWVMGFPIKVRAVRVSVDEPDALIAALR